MQKMDGYNSTSGTKGAYFEDMMAKKTENFERQQNQQLNLQRRKRVQEVYKADLMAKLSAKEGRHNLIKEKRN